MAIHAINSLHAALTQGKTFDNGDARITGATPATGKQISEQVASVIYHKDDPVLPKTNGNFEITEIYQLEDNESVKARYSRIMVLSTHGIASRSVDLEVGYLSAMNQLSSSLQEKDWGFSVRDGELVVSEGSDKLTMQELTQVREALHSAGVTPAAQSVADGVIEIIELERGPTGLSKGIGQYDVNTSNFDEIVNLRRYVQEHLPGGKYGKGVINPHNVEGRYFTGGYSLMKQVSATADKSFWGSQNRPW